MPHAFTGRRESVHRKARLASIDVRSVWKSRFQDTFLHNIKASHGAELMALRPQCDGDYLLAKPPSIFCIGRGLRERLLPVVQTESCSPVRPGKPLSLGCTQLFKSNLVAPAIWGSALFCLCPECCPAASPAFAPLKPESTAWSRGVDCLTE